MSERVRFLLVVGALAAAGGASAAVTYAWWPAAPQQPRSDRAAQTDAEVARCDAARAEYRAARDAVRSCTRDDECVAEERGQPYGGLDECARFVRRDSDRAALNAAEARWVDGNCVRRTQIACRPSRAQCVAGTCTELPPDAVPKDWKRAYAGIDPPSFSMFLPPDFVEGDEDGEDSLFGKFRAPGLELTYEHGRYTSPLEGGADRAHPYRSVRQVRGEDTRIAGLPARWVTWTTKDGIAAAVYVPNLPVRFHYGWKNTAIHVILTCAKDCEPLLQRIAQTLEFY